MRVTYLAHSLASCWNHGNAHFLRGIVSELQRRGHDVVVLEPADGWSAANLALEGGRAALRDYQDIYPTLTSRMYLPATVDLDEVLEDADLVIVHEWNDHDLVRRIGEHRARKGYRLLFHDTHHRSATAPQEMEAYDLRHYDGVLAFGEVVRDLYLATGWARRAWTWHEAADPHVFRPVPSHRSKGDLVWIGNWGDEERTEELHEFLLRPVKTLGLKATVYGVRYPDSARRALEDAGIRYAGWLPNHRAPEVFGQHQLTVHVPRRPYVRALPGIPTIRVFETLACGIPLVSAPWPDREGLFRQGDYRSVSNGDEMTAALARLLECPGEAATQAEQGRQTVLERHTCAHRVDQLLEITDGLMTDRGRSIEDRVLWV